MCAALDWEKACGAVLGVIEEPGAGCERRGGGGKGDVMRVGGSPASGKLDALAGADSAAGARELAPGGGPAADSGAAFCDAPADAALVVAAASSCALIAGLATQVSNSESSAPCTAMTGAP